MNKDATLLCFFRCRNNQAQRLAERDFIAIMAPHTIFLLWLWLTKVKLFIWGFDTMQLPTAGGRIWPNGWTLSNIYEGQRLRGRDGEKLREIEKEKRREPKRKKKKKKICITNDKSKLKVCLSCCHSLPFIFRKQTAVIIDLMVQLEWKHFWA